MPQNRARAVAALLLLACFLIPVPVYAVRNVAARKAAALKQFEKAEKLREALGGRPERQRTKADYNRVVSAYQFVYLKSPTSPKAHEAVVAVAELWAEMGRAFDDPQYFERAIRQYEFLQKEYPGSRYRFEAQFTTGQIYLEDLNKPPVAKAAFQDFLKKYPGHRLAADARKAIADIDNPKATKKEKVAPKPKEAPKEAKSAPENGEERARPAGGPLPLVTRVRYWSTPDYTRVVVDLENEVKYEAGRVANPDRIFFDLQNTKLVSELLGKNFEVEDGFLKQIRVAPYQRDVTRIVLDVQDVSDYSAFFLPNPYRLVIDIHGRRPSTAALQALEPKPAPVKKAIEKTAEEQPDTELASAVKSTSTPTSGPTYEAVAPREPLPEVSAKPHTARPTASGDRSLIRALGLKVGRIVVDAGHGGHDTGTIGPTGYTEKDLVLDIALRLGKLLERKMGADVVYTRDDDTFVPLETRTAIANQQQADLFVSIHANSSRDASARGVETYYLNFSSSPEALEVAARENAVSDKSIHELQDLVKKIALKEKIDESREFAADVQQNLWRGLAKRTPAIRDRGVKKAPFIVLIGANMPSILAEISFVSNPADEKILKRPEYRQRIAESLYRGIAKYAGGLSGVKVASKNEADAPQ